MGKYAKGIKFLYHSAKLFCNKNAGTLLTAGGIAVAAGGVYTTVKAVKKVEAIMDDVEARRSEGHEVRRSEIIKRIGGAICVPVLLFTTSASLFIGSTTLLNKRVTSYASALAIANDNYDKLAKRIREEHPEEAGQLLAPTVTKEEEVLDKETGEVKKEKVTSKVKKLADQHGFWFTEETSEYAINDDPYHNQIAFGHVNQEIEKVIMSKGYITLTEVFGLFKVKGDVIPYRIANNYVWTDTDFFNATMNVVDTQAVCDDGSIMRVPMYYISFDESPRPLHDVNIDYSRLVD